MNTQVATQVRRRVFGIARGHEDLNDHDDMRHDPVTGVLESRREDCAPVAGKSTLNRLELSPVFNAVAPQIISPLGVSMSDPSYCAVR